MQVATKTNTKVLKMSKASNGAIFVKCESEEDSKSIEKSINEEKKEILLAKKVEKNNPKIKIINISSKLDKEDLTADIIKRNNFPEDGIKVVHTYKQKNNAYTVVIAIATADVYQKIMANKSVYVKHENCKVYDVFDVNRCKSCQGYNHSEKKCREQFNRAQMCCLCAGNHDAASCTSQEKRCINCISENKYLTNKRSVNHSADDIKNCESYEVRWEQYINDTNYPWTPEAPF